MNPQQAAPQSTPQSLPQHMPQQMMPQNPLDQLRDIHLPDPISWWPPAPGWWVLALLILATTFYLLRWTSKRRNQRKYRQQALRQLEQIKLDFQNHQSLQVYAQALVALLKKVVKTAYPNQQLESLSPATLINTLNQRSEGKYFSDFPPDQLPGEIETLLYGQVNASAPGTAEQLIDNLASSLASWIGKHKAGKPC